MAQLNQRDGHPIIYVDLDRHRRTHARTIYICTLAHLHISPTTGRDNATIHHHMKAHIDNQINTTHSTDENLLDIIGPKLPVPGAQASRPACPNGKNNREKKKTTENNYLLLALFFFSCCFFLLFCYYFCIFLFCIFFFFFFFFFEMYKNETNSCIFLCIFFAFSLFLAFSLFAFSAACCCLCYYFLAVSAAAVSVWFGCLCVCFVKTLCTSS